MAARFTLAFSVAFAGGRAAGAEIFVDASSTAAAPTGAAGAPFADIASAVDAANAISGEATTIHVASGTYAIATAADLVAVSVQNLSICGDGAAKPQIVIDSGLAEACGSDAPVVFDIASGADCFVISNMAFSITANTEKTRSGNSLGKTGKLFSVTANNCTFSRLDFTQAGTGKSGSGGAGLIYSASPQASWTIGLNLTAVDCRFDGIDNPGLYLIVPANGGKIVRNIFTDSTARYFFQVKQTNGDFVSNRVVNCTSTFPSRSDGYGEGDTMEFAYNIFVNSGIPAITKQKSGMSKARIHHNTVVGASALVHVDKDMTAASSTWKPYIFDNLFVGGEGASVIVEDKAAAPASGYTSSFESGSTFNGNAWFATSFLSGTWPKNYPDGYSLGLSLSGNTKLGAAPSFIETEDVTSPDFYRLNSVIYPWVYDGATAETMTIDKTPYQYPRTYIGAVEPATVEVVPGEYFQIDSLTATVDTLDPPSTATLEVTYSQNGGDVTVSWDYEGDGVFDAEGAATTATATYSKSGDYLPIVKLVDSATGKAIYATNSAPLKVRRSVAFVDANAEAGGDGSFESPFRTLAEVARWQCEGKRIMVRGGPDREYVIDGPEDLIVLEEHRISISSYGDEGNARFTISAGLHAATNNPSVITVGGDAYYATVSGLDFTYYGGKSGEHSGDSLGPKGRVMDIYGDYATVSNCTFRQVGSQTKAMEGEGGCAAVATRAVQNAASYGENLTVADCKFEGATETRQMTAVRCGRDTVVTCNVFTNCLQTFYPVKQLDTSFTYVSNALFNCASVKTTYGNYGELKHIEMAYNVFATEEAVPFIIKGKHGMDGDGSRIHHNTVIGASSFVEVADVANASWHPEMFDNLIVLADGGSVFVENGTGFVDGNYSSFLTDGGATFRNNAFVAGSLMTGTATGIDGYDLSRGLAVEGNIELAAAPTFISTNIGSDDFYRARASANAAWAAEGLAWTDDGAHPDYIGAVEPLRIRGKVLYMLR